MVQMHLVALIGLLVLVVIAVLAAGVAMYMSRKAIKKTSDERYELIAIGEERGRRQERKESEAIKRDAVKYAETIANKQGFDQGRRIGELSERQHSLAQGRNEGKDELRKELGINTAYDLQLVLDTVYELGDANCETRLGAEISKLYTQLDDVEEMAVKATSEAIGMCLDSFDAQSKEAIQRAYDKGCADTKATYNRDDD